MLAYLLRDHADVVGVHQNPDKDIKLMVADLATTTDAMHKRVIEATQKMHEARRRRASKELKYFGF